MAVWDHFGPKKVHLNRYQPTDREHLGKLRKKKEYQRHAKAKNEVKSEIERLREEAYNKDPEEYSHRMINRKVRGGRLTKGKIIDKDARFFQLNNGTYDDIVEKRGKKPIHPAVVIRSLKPIIPPEPKCIPEAKPSVVLFIDSEDE